MADTFESLKTPPHSIGAEQSVLGGLMLDSEAWHKVSGVVHEGDFYRQDHRLIFRSMVALRAKPEQCKFDVITLSDWLDENEHLQDAGGLSYLANMAKDTPSAANIMAYAEIVREKSLQRQLIAVASDAVDSGYRSEGKTAAEMIDALDQQLSALSELVRKKKLQVTKISAAVKRELPAMEQRAEQYLTHGDALLGITTGYKEMDEALSGLIPGDLTIVAARPSMGKSAFEGDLALAAARHCAEAGSGGVLEINLEMPEDQIVQRHMSRAGSVPLQEIRKSWTMREDNWPKLGGAVKAFANMPLWICDGANAGVYTLADISAIARSHHRRLIRETGEGLKLLTVDYLQLMQADTRSRGNRTEDVSMMSRGLKLLAKELGVPIVALSQLNRSLEQRPNKRPVMADLRESGAIEQDADNILFIYRDEVYNPDSPDKGSAEIIIAKQRNGPIGTQRLTFQGQYVRFCDYTPDVYEGYR